MSALLPELLAEGLVLWRVRSSGHHLCCSVCDGHGELVLKIHQAKGTSAIMSETHTDIVTLVESAADLRERYVAVGWEPIDPDA